LIPNWGRFGGQEQEGDGMLRFVNSEICALDAGGPRGNFSLTRLNKVDYSLTITAQETAQVKWEDGTLEFEEGLLDGDSATNNLSTL
jgi:hypothetical protein